MKYLFDSSVLIAAFVKDHPMHVRAVPWIRKAKTGAIDWVVASHSLAELYSVLTKLPLTPKISPKAAWRLIDENIPKQITKQLTAADYWSTIKEASNLGLMGGVVYDALIAKVGKKANVDRLLTFNIANFKRVWPEFEESIVVP